MTMVKKRELYGMYLPIFAIITIAVTAMRTVACFLHFNFSNNRFAPKELISAANYITVAACIYFLTYILTAKKDRKLIPNFTSPITYIPTGLTAAALLFFAKSLLDTGLSEQAKPSGKANNLFMFTAFAAALLALLSIVHFVLTAVDERNHSGNRAKFGLFTVLLLSVYACYLYFSTNLAINAPNKTTDQMAYLFAAIFFLYETRLSLGREKWRGYICFGFISAMLTAYSSIPSIIIYIAKGSIISNSIYESFLTLTLFIFITARMLLAGELIEDIPSPIVASIIEAADARSKEIAISEESASEQAPLENQITIEDIRGEKLEFEELEFTKPKETEDILTEFAAEEISE